jgi:hypothetical protein
MPGLLENIYFLVFGGAVFSSFWASPATIPGLRLLQALLVCGMVNELVVLYLRQSGSSDHLPHHIYVPLEYILLVVFYCRQMPHRSICRTMLLSIPAYVFMALMVYRSPETFSQFPSLTYLASAFLNVVWLVLVFFYFRPPGNVAITALPLFWILAALLVFYAGVFCFLATYQYLLQHHRTIADQSRQLINQSLNILLYIMLSYAFLCSTKVKSFS